MEVEKIVEGMTAVQVAEAIDRNFKNQNKILEDDIQKQNNAIGISEYKAFSEAESVAVGDVRLYKGVLYECVEETTGEFDAKKWKATSFKKETEAKLSELGSEVREKRTILQGKLIEINDVNVISGAYITLRGSIAQLESGCYTSPVRVEKDFVLILLARGGSSNGVPALASVSLTDSTGSYYSPKVTRGFDDSPVSQYYAREDCYIALSWVGSVDDYKLYKIHSDILKQIYTDHDKAISSLFENSLGDKTDKGISQKLSSSLSRTICSTLYDANDNLINNIDDVEKELGVYLSNKGTLVKGGTRWYGVTTFYIVRGLTTIHYTGNLNPNTSPVAAVCFYDEDKKFISSVYTVREDYATGNIGEYTTTINELDIEVPSTAVFARSCSYSSPVRIAVGSNDMINTYLYDAIIWFLSSEIKKNINDSITNDNRGVDDGKSFSKTVSNALSLGNGILTEVEIEGVNEGYYIDKGGVKRVLASARYSNPIEVKKGDYFVFIGQGGQSGEIPTVATISITDADGTYYNPVVVKGKANTANIYSQYYVEEDGYIALSWLETSSETYGLVALYKNSSDIIGQIYKNLRSLKNEININENISDNIDYLSKRGFSYFFDKCICIGDSVTHGHVYDYPRTPADGKVMTNKSYPHYLAKMTGWQVENAGVAGITTIGWWDTRYSRYVYTDYQLAIIELGYNKGLTDTLDTDVEPYNNYEDYAETNTGCYCKIVEAIKSVNPNILLVLVISSNFSATNELVVRKIAERYGLPLINLKDKSYIDLSDDKYHGNSYKDEVLAMDYTHFNFIGYCAKAKFIYNALSYIIESNAKMINDLQSEVE